MAANHGRAGWRPRRWLATLLLLMMPVVAPAAPATLVSALQVQRDGVATSLPLDRRYLRLQGGDTDLHVRLHPQPGAAVRWRLRIDGIDGDWIEQRWPAEQRWSRLPPGPHRLQVAIDRGHGWEPAEERLLLVDSPWWQTRDVLLLIGALLLALLATVVLVDRGRRRREAAWQLAQARREEAERQSEAKTRFLATLGHELRTPLTGVLGMAELLQAGDLSAYQRGQVEAIGHAGRHLLRLVNDALDLARIEAGRLGLERRSFALWPLLQEVVGLLQPMAAGKGLEFALACHPRTPEALTGDPTRLRQILFNLGHNAIKFCSRGQVTIQVEPLAPFGLRLIVQDSGPGLDAGQQSRLFRRFEPGADGGVGTGSGLGLAISRELAVAMGGRIELHSAPGQGARFEVELPLPAAIAPLPTPADPATDTPAPARRLLLVEDDPLVAEVVAGLLRERGHAVLHAAHGLAALSELDCGRFDLAIVDLDLPGMDGLQLARLVRGRWPLPLLALTARADADAEPQALAAGMAAFLRKPVGGDELAALIERLVTEAED
jgi:signal transduction histidine kinase/ActR/RegA family two-component response regulator